jgi:hypothetical protein
MTLNPEHIERINRLPEYAAMIMEANNSDRAFLITSRRRGDTVYAATSVHGPLMRAPLMKDLPIARENLGVNDICLCLQRVTPARIKEATRGFADRFQLMAELTAALDHLKELYVAYVVIHANYGPAKDMTIFVGGDCYRDEESIGHSFNRVRNLAAAMLRKAVMVFPDYPALHGGKKGEWLVADRNGRRLEGLSERARVALGSTIIADGVRFLNRLRVTHAVRDGVLRHEEDFESRPLARSDTASPDMLSGKYWRDLTTAWAARGHHLEMVTCLPSRQHGPLVESKDPTARGAVTTALELIRRRWPDTELSKVHILMEGLGGVGAIALDLLKTSGVDPEKLTGFDIDAAAVQTARSRYGEHFYQLSAEEFYTDEYLRRLRDRVGDAPLVWFNNGPGDKATPDQIARLLKAGVKIFCGAANNLVRLADAQDTLGRIFKADAWYWPDEVTSGGGWALAVIDVVNRSRGARSDNKETLERIYKVIENANLNTIDETFEKAGTETGRIDGRSLYDAVNGLVEERVQRALAYDRNAAERSGAEILAMASTRDWALVPPLRAGVRDAASPAGGAASGPQATPPR